MPTIRIREIDHIVLRVVDLDKMLRFYTDVPVSVPRIAVIATGRNGDDRETTSRADTRRYLPGLAALRAPHFGPPFGFDQMARSRARPSGQIRWVSAQPSGRTIITIWSNLNDSYPRDRTPSCSIERRQDAIGLVQLRAGSALVDLVPVDGKLGSMGGAAPGREGRNVDHFCFRVEPFDADAIYAHLAQHDVQAGPVSQRYGAEGEGPSIYLDDPEGNTIELKGPPDA